MPVLPNEIVQAGLDGDLVLFVGAGASMLLNLPSWGRLASKAFEDLRAAGHLNYSEIEQLRNLDPKKQLSIAKLVAEECAYELHLERHLIDAVEGESIYKAINDIGCPCVTTNYDNLLSPRYLATKDGSTTSAPVRRIIEPGQFFGRLLNEPGTVVHLHGSVSDPATMVVTTREYLAHYDHDNVKEFLTELFSRKAVLFLGYGLDEAEILEHVLRRAGARKIGERRRFALQGYFMSQTPLYESLHRYYEASFGVHLLGFLRDREDYRCLERIVKNWAPQLEIRTPPLASDAEFLYEVLGRD